MHQIFTQAPGDFLSFNIQTTQGEFQFIDFVIEKNIHPSILHLPAIWPPTTDQVGPCCGIYAFKHAWENSGIVPRGFIPPARKYDLNPSEKNDFTYSLRSICKKNSLTVYGAIYNIFYFAHLAQLVKLKGGFPVIFSRIEHEYIHKICQVIDSGYTLIIACDLKNDTDFPGPHSGRRTHWSTILGYIFFKQSCYFLVTQYGNYYLWSAKALYKSNFEMPLINYHFGYHGKNKNPETGDSSYLKVKDLKQTSGIKLAHVKERTLRDFKFTGYAVPSPYVQNAVNCLPALIAGYAKKFMFNNPISNLAEEKLLINNYEKMTGIIDWMISNTKIESNLHLSFLKYLSDLLTVISKEQCFSLVKGINFNCYSSSLKLSNSYYQRLKITLDYFIVNNCLSQIPLLIEEKSLTFVHKILITKINQLAQMGNLRKIIKIKRIFPKISFEQTDDKGENILLIAAKNNQICIIAWLLKNNLCKELIDNKASNCANYLINHLLGAIKDLDQKKDFCRAFSPKDQVLFSIRCLINCIKDYNYFSNINRILKIYFKLLDFNNLVLSSTTEVSDHAQIKMAVNTILTGLNSPVEINLKKLFKDLNQILIYQTASSKNRMLFFDLINPPLRPQAISKYFQPRSS